MRGLSLDKTKLFYCWQDKNYNQNQHMLENIGSNGCTEFDDDWNWFKKYWYSTWQQGHRIFLFAIEFECSETILTFDVSQKCLNSVWLNYTTFFSMRYSYIEKLTKNEFLWIKSYKSIKWLFYNIFIQWTLLWHNGRHRTSNQARNFLHGNK